MFIYLIIGFIWVSLDTGLLVKYTVNGEIDSEFSRGLAKLWNMNFWTKLLLIGSLSLKMLIWPVSIIMTIYLFYKFDKNEEVLGMSEEYFFGE